MHQPYLLVGGAVVLMDVVAVVDRAFVSITSFVRCYKLNFFNQENKATEPRIW